MMAIDEMQKAVCEKLPELIHIDFCAEFDVNTFNWRDTGNQVNWPTEGLQVCHEAEKLIEGSKKWNEYTLQLAKLKGYKANIHTDRSMVNIVCNATYEQRLETLCRVWFPDKFL